jgi:hypothetical protein
MRRPIVLVLAISLITVLSAGGDASAAKKKPTAAQMDGAILVVSGADGPMPRGSGVWGGYSGTGIWGDAPRSLPAGGGGLAGRSRVQTQHLSDWIKSSYWAPGRVKR